MYSGSVIFYKIATTCLLIFVGYISRRMQLVPENSLSVFSKFTLNVATPCYLVYNMTNSVSWETLGASWPYPLLGAGLLAASDLFGYAMAWLRGGRDIGTFRILVAIPNWIFMAMAVCEPLFGAAGVRVVLLFNLGITLYVWSFGMTSFRGGMDWAGVRELFLNPQIAATVIGIAFALLFPGLRGMERLSADALAALPFSLGALTPVWETIYLTGTTALPMSIILIGFHLGAAGTQREGKRAEASLLVPLVQVTLLRLLVAPALVILILAGLMRLGFPLGEIDFVTSALIMAMPPAVVCIAIADVYGGDRRLAAGAILWSSVASLVTAPAAAWAAGWIYGHL